MEWLAPAGKAVRLVHDSWCDTVGPPAFRTPDTLGEPEAAHEQPGALTIVSWNTHGGVADIDALLQALRARTVPVTTQVVLLLQEVVRRSPSVPPSVADAAPVPGSLHGPGHGEDVADLAARLGLSLVYVPSMRNGDAPDGGRPAEDRGNAILSSLPLTSPVAIELPLTHQRRVAVAATVGAQVKGVSQMPLRVVSFHLDTTGGRGQQAAFLGDWLRDEAARRVAVVAGGDVNALWGTRDAAYDALTGALPVEACGRRRTNRWPWGLHALLGWWRGRLDYVFSTLPRHAVRTTCATWPAYLESDHLPVIVDLQPLTADR